MASNTYEAVGNKEDVSEIITNISPDQTSLYEIVKNLCADYKTYRVYNYRKNPKDTKVCIWFYGKEVNKNDD